MRQEKQSLAWLKKVGTCLMITFAGLVMTNCGSDDNGEPGNDIPNKPDTPVTPIMPNLNAYAQAIVDDMVMVAPGTFLMGSSDTDADAENAEKPQHSVTIARHYLIGKFEVTQQLWQDVMGANPSGFEGATRPVERVSYNDVQAFLVKLNEKAGVTFTLPTEEEWEYAARGGQNSTWKYAGSDNVDEVAWYKANSESRTHDIEETKAKLKPNSLGIYNMSGNVEEWTCTNWKANYQETTTANPNAYSVRGGEWAYDNLASRVAQRHGHQPTELYADLGFRIVLEL